jgi:PilZ domain-containing protein
MVERRDNPRFPASWPVFLWPTADVVLFGLAVDISRHGMRVVLSKPEPAVTISPSETCRVDVSLWPWPHADLRYIAVVRHLSADTIGVEMREALPGEGFAPCRSLTTVEIQASARP